VIASRRTRALLSAAALLAVFALVTSCAGVTPTREGAVSDDDSGRWPDRPRVRLSFDVAPGTLITVPLRDCLAAGQTTHNGETAEDFMLSDLSVTPPSDYKVLGPGTSAGDVAEPTPGSTTHRFAASAIRDVTVAVGQYDVTDLLTGREQPVPGPLAGGVVGHLRRGRRRRRRGDHQYDDTPHRVVGLMGRPSRTGTPAGAHALHTRRLQPGRICARHSQGSQ
jgi:hypothetical protein